VVGDVSGKGAPAAIYAALVSGILRSHCAIEPSPQEMLSAVNLSLTERPIEAQFVTLLYAVWDDRERSLSIANSGLPPPLLCHEGHVKQIEATGLPLGLFEDADFEEFNFDPSPGDLFVFFSDGILDAGSQTGQMFGRERLEHVINKVCTGSAQELVDAIFAAVAEHSAGVETFDDQTVVVLKVSGDAPKHRGKKQSQKIE